MSERLTADLRHLRPATIPEMADHTFTLLARRGNALLLLAMIAALPDLFLAVFRVRQTGELLPAWQTALYLMLYILSEFSYAIALGCCFQTYLFPQRPLSFKALVRATVPRLPAFVLTRFVLQMAIVTLGGLLPTTLLVHVPAAENYPVRVILAAACLLLTVRLLISWALVPVAIVIERKAFLGAAIRSSDLMRTPFSLKALQDSPAVRALLGFLPALVAALSIIAIAQVCATALDRPLITPTDVAGLRDRKAGCFVRAALELFWTPLLATLLTTLYVECRMRRDGLDFEVRLIENNAGPTSAMESELPGLV